MEIRQLRTFMAVAKFMSFNRAADHLNYAQSTVSAQVQALEEEFGVPFFERLGRRITLTEAGDRLLQYAEKLLDMAEEAKTGVVGGADSTGSLTVRLPESLGVHRFPEIFGRFAARFPRIRLNIINCTYNGLERDLRKGITDVAFLMNNSLQASDLVIETVGFESLLVVAHAAHPLARRSAVRGTDLNGETILLSCSDCSYRREFEKALTQLKVKPGSIFEFNSVATLKECVCAGIGVSILPEVTVRADIQHGRLAVLPWQSSELRCNTLMIRHQDKWLSPILDAFMSISREELGKAHGPVD
ncbi:MAG: LysR family transcriptional regulator [Hyphomicrobiales bacterium]|nr:LysR family transcriptional regulator [Hyphomicrobiales bacterium]